MTTYDIDRDILWVLSADYTSASDPVLTEFHLDSREALDHKLSGATNWLGYGDAVATDRDGRVWAAWGDRLIRFDSDTEAMEEWAIPAAEGAATDDATDVGVAVDVAVDSAGVVLVARNGLKAVSLLDPETGVWDSAPTGEVQAAFVSRLSVLPDGTILLNGLQSESAWAIASIDRTKGEATVIPVDALGYGVLEDGSVAYLDSATGSVKRTDNPSGEADSIGPTFSNPTLENALTIDLDGNIWLRHDSELRKDIVKVDATTGEASLFPYPLKVTEGISAIGVYDLSDKTIALDPGIQGMVADKRGDIWIITDSGGESASYPPLYRLDPGG